MAGALPELVAPLTEKAEAELVHTLLKEIKDNFGLNLDLHPNLERGAVTLDDGDCKKRLILIGRSHMCKTHKHLPKETVNLSTPGFVATPAASTQVAETLRDYCPGSGDVIIMDLLSNSAFCGTDGNGLPLPQFRGEDGTYHVQGMLVASPPSMIKKALQSFNKIAELVKDSLCVLVALTPRYVLQRCCTNADHLENFRSESYEVEIQDAVENHIQLLDVWATEHELKYVILDPISTDGLSVSALRERTASNGAPLWTGNDGVHLSSSGYSDLAKAILAVSERMTAEDNMEETRSMASSDSNNAKRSRLDSVVTRPPTTTNAVHRPPKLANWLHGRGDTNRGTRGGGGNPAAGTEATSDTEVIPSVDSIAAVGVDAADSAISIGDHKTRICIGLHILITKLGIVWDCPVITTDCERINPLRKTKVFGKFATKGK